MRRRTKGQPIGGALAWRVPVPGVFLRQCVRHGGEELRHLHQRPLQPAEDGLQILGMRRLVGLHAEDPLPGHARGDAAHGAGGPCHPAQLAEDGAAGSSDIAFRAVIAIALQFVDKARDHVQAALPEAGVGGIEPEGRQQLLVPQGAAGPQQVEVFLLEVRTVPSR